MIECIKRQRNINRADNTETYRCLNRKCGQFGHTVTDTVCAKCTSAVGRKKKPCGERPVKTAEIVNMSDTVMGELMESAGLEPDGEVLKAGKPGHSAMLQLWMYKEALIRWVREGRPVRTQEEVEHIHTTHCLPCEYYADGKCKGCGCKVSTGSFAIFNKIKMGSEHCPEGKW